MKNLNNIHIQDIPDNSNNDFYDNFREKLMSVEQFPMMYTFKFILPANEASKQEIADIFAHPSTKIQTRDSKTGKYNSLTVGTFVSNADEVIAYYKKVSAIDKVIML